MWCVKKKIMIFLIRNINNFKTLINNINSFYWTRNRVCKKEQKNAEIKNNVFKIKINLQITKQKQKNKNDHQIKIITKIYHIIAKKKEKKWHARFLSKLLYFYVEIFEALNFSSRNIKHDRKKAVHVHVKYSRFW